MQSRMKAKNKGIVKKQKGNCAVIYLVSYFPMAVFSYEIIGFPYAIFQFQKGVHLLADDSIVIDTI